MIGDFSPSTVVTNRLRSTDVVLVIALMFPKEYEKQFRLLEGCMRNAAIGFLMFVLACPICAVAQLPSASDCDQLIEKAGKLIMVLQNAKTKWQDKKGWQEAPDLAMQLNGCKTRP